jgi:anthranilate synthase/aminodeoxychorismate synthase-like glutamine amidotransferase
LIVLVDNYDSFVHNLARYFERLGVATRVVRNDATSVDSLLTWQPQAIVLSPGPCGPDEAGISLEVVRRLYTKIPLLGVCLGHQTIAQALGATIVRGRQPIHGQSSLITHQNSRLFAGLPNPMAVGRYHSLVVDPTSLGGDLVATAHTDDGVLMALEHRTLPVFGVQFHPESILTEAGFSLLANFLNIAGVGSLAAADAMTSELELASPPPRVLPSTPIAYSH